MRGVLAAEEHMPPAVIVHGRHPRVTVHPMRRGRAAEGDAAGWRQCSAPTSDRSAACWPRPCGSQPLAPTHGGTLSGRSRAARASGSEPRRRCGSGGSGPSFAARTADSPKTPLASPHCHATISSIDAPQRRAAASTLPALVPTTRSTSAAAPGSRSCSRPARRSSRRRRVRRPRRALGRLRGWEGSVSSPGQDQKPQQTHLPPQPTHAQRWPQVMMLPRSNCKGCGAL